MDQPSSRIIIRYQGMSSLLFAHDEVICVPINVVDEMIERINVRQRGRDIGERDSSALHLKPPRRRRRNHAAFPSRAKYQISSRYFDDRARRRGDSY